MSISVLLIEDNQAIAEQVLDYLSEQGMQVDYAANGQGGLKLVEQHRYDVILLDLMLPDIDGLRVCQRIKAQSNINTPVLMLTARDSIAEKGDGFDAGADDYLTKPFALAEVAMRCQALARRHRLHQSSVIRIDELEVDVQGHTAHRNQQPLNLSAKDFAILLLLAEAYPNAVSRSTLTEKIWGDDFPDSDALRSHIYTLRNTLDKPFRYPMIKTIHGVGFKLETQA